MENTDAKVFLMIEDLSRHACLELLDRPVSAPPPTDGTLLTYLRSVVRQQYETGDIPAEEIIAAWNDDTWNGKD